MSSELRTNKTTNKMIGIKYGKKAPTDGKTTFDVIHKWGRYIGKPDQCRMVIQRILKDFDDSESFDFWEDKNGVCCGRAVLKGNPS